MSICLRRREFIAGLGGAATWSFAARAQRRDRVRRIGVLMTGDESDPVVKPRVSAFTQALAGLGWSDGRNVRWGSADINRTDIILAGGGTVTVALQRKTRTIPIVFASLNDPAASGLVERLDRPVGTSPASPTWKPRCHPSCRVNAWC
jgi:putative ABC transport system substrate-binding protein